VLQVMKRWSGLATKLPHVHNKDQFLAGGKLFILWGWFVIIYMLKNHKFTEGKTW